ncbi:unnamed protein product [Staurois parvus]|uniref:Uncharacterized protein n=1 Tax=Staurois parvus TaxID=386267 RepID=A0ABN9DBC3_9NEOB|nr:unnamed protein product [Staurois parvus]
MRPFACFYPALGVLLPQLSATVGHIHATDTGVLVFPLTPTMEHYYSH